MSNKFTSTIETYNKHAKQFVQHFENKLDFDELDRFLAHIPENGNILDAGCGSARDAAYFVSKGRQALGIDLSEGLLAEAAKLHPEVPTQLMSLSQITLPDVSYDGVWCKAALLHLDRTQVPQVLQSFNRIIKDRGYLFVQTKLGEGEGTQPVPFDESMTRFFTFFSNQEMQDMIKDAGFDIINAYEFNSKQRSMGSRDQDWLVIFAQKK